MRGLASGDDRHERATPLTPTLSPPKRGEGAPASTHKQNALNQPSTNTAAKSIAA
jgi:hypothetical protein